VRRAGFRTHTHKEAGQQGCPSGVELEIPRIGANSPQLVGTGRAGKELLRTHTHGVRGAQTAGTAKNRPPASVPSSGSIPTVPPVGRLASPWAGLEATTDAVARGSSATRAVGRCDTLRMAHESGGGSSYGPLAARWIDDVLTFTTDFRNGYGHEPEPDRRPSWKSTRAQKVAQTGRGPRPIVRAHTRSPGGSSRLPWCITSPVFNP
jgi:hypothetical protein